MTLKTAPENHLVAHTDGGARGNPGPAAYGVIIHDAKGRKIASLSQYLGRQTNNFAEYQALIAALEYAVEHGPKALKVISDSELMVRQIEGIYKVKDPTLRDLHGRASQLIRQLHWFQIEHTLRGGNREADLMANAAMDKGSGRDQSHHPRAQISRSASEYNGVVRNGKVELLDGDLPEGTAVRVRVKG